MSFAAYQIVVIEQSSARLYGELVQQIEERDTCWFRPIVLQLTDTATGHVSLLDMGDGPDILCACQQIRPVLDTDWIGLQAEYVGQKQTCDFAEANQHLRDFLATLFSPQKDISSQDAAVS